MKHCFFPLILSGFFILIAVSRLVPLRLYSSWCVQARLSRDEPPRVWGRIRVGAKETRLRGHAGKNLTLAQFFILGNNFTLSYLKFFPSPWLQLYPWLVPYPRQQNFGYAMLWLLMLFIIVADLKYLKLNSFSLSHWKLRCYQKIELLFLLKYEI